MSLSPLDLLDSGNFQTYNRQVARVLGSVNAAIMLAELVNRYNYHKSEGELKSFQKYEGEWFYYTVEKCTDRTVLSRKEQETAIKIIERFKLFEKRSIGIPPRRHFRLDIEKIIEFIGGLKELFIKPEKGAMNGPKVAICNDRKWRNNKEPVLKTPIEEDNVETVSSPVREVNASAKNESKSNESPKPTQKITPARQTDPKSNPKPKFVELLNRDQRILHDEIIAYKPRWGTAPESDAVCGWFNSKTTPFTVEQVRSALEVYKQDVLDAIKRDGRVESMGGAIRAVLNTGRKPRNIDAEFNHQHAENAARINPFIDATKCYARFKIGAGAEEIMYNQPKAQFLHQFERYKRLAEDNEL